MNRHFNSGSTYDHLKSTHLMMSALFICFSIKCPVVSLGCPLCFPFPDKSAADYVFESELVVFAKLDPRDSFSLIIDRKLKGFDEGTAIDHFVNTTMRRRLIANRESVVVLVREKEKAEWRSLGVADMGYQQVIERIVAHERDWSGEQGTEKRVRFFVRLFEHEHPAIFELAYQELSRAPYTMIKRIGRWVPKSRVRELLSQREFVKWRALSILLLAQNAEEEDKQLLKQMIASAKGSPDESDLAALATAWIELDGASAIQGIESMWLSDGACSAEASEQILTALRIQQKCAKPQVRNRIDRCLSRLNLESN